METQRNLSQKYFQDADVFMIAISSDEVVVDINNAACQILGFSADEVLGKKWFDNFTPANQRENIRRLFHDTLNGDLHHVHYEHPVITKQGKELTLNFHNLIVSGEKGSKVGMLSSADDVTARREKEKALKKIENRLQVTIETMLEGYQIIDYDWRYVYLNETAAKQGRRSKKELLGHTMMQAYPGIDKTELFDHLRNCMINRVPSKIDNEFTFPDGSKGWFELRIEPVPEGISILSIDISRKREVEAELSQYRSRLEEVVAERTAQCTKINKQLTLEIQEHRKTEEGLKLRATILDNAMNAIFLVNTKGDFAYANEAASKAYGYSQDEFLNMNFNALLRPVDVPMVGTLLSRIKEKGGTSLEMIHKTKDSAEMPIKLFSNVVKTAHGEFIVFVIQRLDYR